jgi:Na+/H+-dicarboxylate symporter
MSLINSFFVMIISLIFAFVLNVGLGFMLDRLLIAFAGAGLYDVSEAWDPTSIVGMVCNNFYLLIYVVAILGIAQFVYTAVRRQRYDAYEPVEP